MTEITKIMVDAMETAARKAVADRIGIDPKHVTVKRESATGYRLTVDAVVDLDISLKEHTVEPQDNEIQVISLAETGRSLKLEYIEGQWYATDDHPGLIAAVAVKYGSIYTDPDGRRWSLGRAEDGKWLVLPVAPPDDFLDPPDHTAYVTLGLSRIRIDQRGNKHYLSGDEIRSGHVHWVDSGLAYKLIYLDERWTAHLQQPQPVKPPVG